MMEALTPASADGLPPLGELVADVPFWRYPSGAAAGEGVAHLRVWTTATVPQGHLAAVTETGAAARSNFRRAADRDCRAGAADPRPEAGFAGGCADGLWYQPDSALRHRLPYAANHLELRSKTL